MRDFVTARLGERSTAAGVGMILAGMLGVPADQTAQISEGISKLLDALRDLSPLWPFVLGAIGIFWREAKPPASSPGPGAAASPP